MLILYILVIGTTVGIIPTLFKLSHKTTRNIILGIIGAFIGAFLGFGDAPILLKYHISTRPLAITGAVLLVLISLLVERKKSHWRTK